MKISQEAFDRLSYGDVVLATSIDCTDTSQDHVCIIISSGTVEHISKKQSKAVKFALCLSSTDSKEGHVNFSTDELPQEIQDYYMSISSTSRISKLRYNEPITILRNGIMNKFSVRLDSMLNQNNLICDLLCSLKYIFHNLVKRGEKYKNHYITIGEICPCYDYGQANANEVKVCPECHAYNNCDFPDSQTINYLNSQISCWTERLGLLGYDEFTSCNATSDSEVFEIWMRLEKDKCELMQELDKSKM